MVVRRMVATVTQRQVRYVTPVPVMQAEGLVDTVYKQSAAEMKIVTPPLLAHSPSPPVLAACWALMRETLIAHGAVDRLDKEVVAAAVSVATTCPYCVDMHSTGIYDLADESEAEAVACDRLDDVRDPRTREIAHWARTAHLPGTAAQAPPFPPEQLPEMVGTVVAFHYLTRMVNVFLGNALLPAGLGPSTRRRMKKGISVLMSGSLRAVYAPGLSAGLLDPAGGAADTEWAGGNMPVTQAVTRAYAAFEAAGTRALPIRIRELVGAQVASWRGEDYGPPARWCDEMVARLPAPERAAGRLALLTAFSSSNVDAETVLAFQRHQPGDRELVEATAWASYVAARKVGGLHARLV